MAKTVPVTFEKEKDLLKIQKLLGQTLLDPPNVAGWKGDKAWIDANTIMIRLKLPSVVLNSGFIAFDEKDEFRKQFFKNTKRKRPFKTVPKWDVFEEHFKLTKTEHLQDHIIQGKINKGTLDYLKTLNKSSKQVYCIQLMSIPEYQMC